MCPIVPNGAFAGKTMTDKIKVDKKLSILIRKYDEKLRKVEDEFWGKVCKLEKEMAKETSIEDIEFFWMDGECVGVGTSANPKKMKLIHRKYYE